VKDKAPPQKRPAAAPAEVKEKPAAAEVKKKPAAAPAAAAAEVDQYYFGYNKEVRLAWRLRSECHLKQCEKELSLPIEIPDDAAPGDCILAKWSDGLTRRMLEITVGMFRGQDLGRKLVGDAALWNGIRKIDGHALKLAQRPDRQLLLSLFEQTRQVCAVQVAWFGEVPLPQPAVVPKDTESLTKAMAFLKPLAIAYASGEIKDRSDLTEARDRKLEEIGLGSKAARARVTKVSLKRPAAAPASDGQISEPQTKKPPRRSASRSAAPSVSTGSAAPSVETGPSSASSASAKPTAISTGMPTTTLDDEVAVIEGMTLSDLGLDL
jgi:hypothetical protein